MRLSWVPWVGFQSSDKGPYQRGETQKRPCEDRGRDQREEATSPGMPAAPRSRRRWEGASARACGGSGALLTPQFQTLRLHNGREQISAAQAPTHAHRPATVVICYGHPGTLTPPPDAPTAEKAIGCTAGPGEQPGWGCRSCQHREVVAPWRGERRGLGGAQGAAAYRLGEEREPEGGWEGVAAPGTGDVCRPCVLDKDSPRGRALEGRDGLGQGWCVDRPRSS